MCSTTTCCFNLPRPNSPTTTSPIAPKSSSRVSCADPVSPSWRTRSVAAAAAGIAYAMIGIGVADDLYFFTYAGAAVAEDVISDDEVRQRQGRAPTRWDNGGACPPWHSKTFELIVPEKLPRPEPRRRWESVGDFNTSGRPGAKKGSNGMCFSL